jgi:hypothetical protein
MSATPGDIIGNYRVLALLFEKKFSDIYFVEQATSPLENTLAALILWRKMSSDEHAVEEIARALAPKHGFSLIDSGKESTLAYLVLSYNTARKEALLHYIDDLERRVKNEASPRFMDDLALSDPQKSVAPPVARVKEEPGEDRDKEKRPEVMKAAEDQTQEDAVEVLMNENEDVQEPGETPPGVSKASEVREKKESHLWQEIAETPTVAMREEAIAAGSARIATEERYLADTPTIAQEPVTPLPVVPPVRGTGPATPIPEASVTEAKIVEGWLVQPSQPPISPAYPMPGQPVSGGTSGIWSGPSANVPTYSSGEYIPGTSWGPQQAAGMSGTLVQGVADAQQYHPRLYAGVPARPTPRRPLGSRPQVKPLPLWVRWTALGAVIVILLITAGVSYLFIPVSAMQIDVTPQTHNMKKAYKVYTSVVATSEKGNGDVITQQEEASTEIKSFIGTATGKGMKGGAYAAGYVIVSGVTIFSGAASQDVAMSRLTVTGGESIIINSFTAQSTPGWSTKVTAVVETKGAQGNIPAGYVDGDYQSSTIQLHVSNPEPFTGGADDHEYTFATAQDITNAQNAFENQLKDEATELVKKKVTNREIPMDGVISCAFTRDDTMSSKVNAEGSQVKIVGSATCTMEVVNLDDVQKVAQNLQGEEVNKLYGGGYIAMDETKIEEPKEISATAGKAFTVTVNGWWSYYIEGDEVAQKIVGKTQWQASDLLHGYSGIKAFHFSATGLGGSMPRSVDNIKIVAKPPTAA